MNLKLSTDMMPERRAQSKLTEIKAILKYEGLDSDVRVFTEKMSDPTWEVIHFKYQLKDSDLIHKILGSV